GTPVTICCFPKCRFNHPSDSPDSSHLNEERTSYGSCANASLPVTLKLENPAQPDSIVTRPDHAEVDGFGPATVRSLLAAAARGAVEVGKKSPVIALDQGGPLVNRT